MGADLCSTLGNDERGRLRLRAGDGMGAGGGPQSGSGGITPENFGNFIYQTVHFGEYLCDNWSTDWVHFAPLNTDVEAFLNQLSY